VIIKGELLNIMTVTMSFLSEKDDDDHHIAALLLQALLPPALSVV